MIIRPWPRMVVIALSTVVAVLFISKVSLAQPTLVSEEPLTLNHNFEFQKKDDGPGWEKAEDLSGVACFGAMGNATRACIFVNDGGRFVVPAYLDVAKRTLAVSGRVKILDDDPNDLGTTYGSLIDPTSVQCGTMEDFGGFDGGEAIAITRLNGPDLAIIAGSHGCDRTEETYKQSSFVVASISEYGRVEVSFRLSEALRSVQLIAATFGKRLQNNGISIEGVAAVKDPLNSSGRLLFGFRTPLVQGDTATDQEGSIQGDAIILSVDRNALFTSDGNLMPATIQVPLGDMGIRDMFALDDRRLLILAGAPGNGDAYRLVLFDLLSKAVTPLLDLTGTSESKPEGLFPIGYSVTDGQETLQLIVLRDGEQARDGAPVVITLTLPQG